MNSFKTIVSSKDSGGVRPVPLVRRGIAESPDLGPALSKEASLAKPCSQVPLPWPWA